MIIKVNTKTYPFNLFRECANFPDGCNVYKNINKGQLIFKNCKFINKNYIRS